MNNYFTVGKNNIGYVSNQFKEWFGKVKVTPKKGTFIVKDLERNMNDQEIMDELKPQIMTLDDVAGALEGDQLQKNGNANIFYVKKNDRVLVVLNADWLVGRWYVCAFDFAYAREWHAGYRVVIGNSLTFETFETSGTLDERVKELETKVEKLLNVINV